jgi:hypothetical protein
MLYPAAMLSRIDEQKTLMHTIHGQNALITSDKLRMDSVEKYG